MNDKINNQARKFNFGIVLAGIILFLCFGLSSSPAARAQGVSAETATETQAPPAVPKETATPAPNDYFSTNTVLLSDGTSLDEMIINGPPTPPPGFSLERQAVTAGQILEAAGSNSLIVPAYNWFFGCSATSGAMIAAYYDRNGYPNMYTGPTNGGVMPLDNSVWPTWYDGHSTYRQNPLDASNNGLDGRSVRGSIDDYWVSYGSTAPDPFIGHWQEHTLGDAIGDYMKTSQSSYSNVDGSTTFYYSGNSSPLSCSTIAAYGWTRDGTLGRKLFYEARGYTVTDCYYQLTDNQVSGGFSFAQYKAEIDAGRPVLLNLNGHSIVGVGYDSSTNTVYLHDTWDYATHSMTWGGSYAGMTLEGASIVNLQPVSPPGAFIKSSPTNGATSQFTNPTLSWAAANGTTGYEYCYDTTDNSTCDGSWTSVGTNTSVRLSGLSTSTPYYWQVRANNAMGTTYADGGAWWNFTTSNIIYSHQFFFPLIF